jgi:hypothetical protein
MGPRLERGTILLQSLTELDSVSNEPDAEELIAVAEADRHHLTVIASEFSRFIGQHNLSMLDFLGEVGYDGEDYEYRTKNTSVTLKKPLMNILGVHDSNDAQQLDASGRWWSRISVPYDSSLRDA